MFFTRKMVYVLVVLGITVGPLSVAYYLGYKSVDGIVVEVYGICTKVSQDNPSISFGFNLDLFSPVSLDTQLVNPAFTLTVFIPSNNSLNSGSVRLGPVALPARTLHTANADIIYSMKFYLNDSGTVGILSAAKSYNSTLTMTSLVVSGLYRGEIVRSRGVKLPRQWDYDVAQCPSNLE